MQESPQLLTLFTITPLPTPAPSLQVVDELLFQWSAAMAQLAAALLAAHVAVHTRAKAEAAAATKKVAAALASAPPPLRQPTSTTTPPGSSAPTRASSSSLLPTPLPSHPLPTTSTSGSTPPAANVPVAPPRELPPPDSPLMLHVLRCAVRVRQLQERIRTERARALRTPTRRAYFALFGCQRDAAAAAQCAPLAPPSRTQPLHFRACAAPPPDAVYWQVGVTCTAWTRVKQHAIKRLYVALRCQRVHD